MQPFLLIKQTIESNFDTGAIILDGANAKLTDSSEALSRTAGRKHRTFRVSVQSGDESSSITFKRHEDYGLVVDSVELRESDLPNGLTIKRGMRHDEIAKQMPPTANPFAKIFEGEGGGAEWKVIRKKCFLHVEFGPGKGKLSSLRMGVSPSAPIESFVKQLIHVPGLRGNPERSYRLAESGEIYPGSFELYVASIVNKWKNDPRYKNKFDQLADDLRSLGLASRIDTTRINDTRVEVRVSRFSGAQETDCVNIADVGFGVSQTLPVLVALLAAREKQYVYIEQPELHLHPRAQYKLAEIIGRAINNGVKVIIETHSSILIRGIQTLVARRKLQQNKVSLNWFKQEQRTGRSVVSVASLDENGAFGSWPADFDEVSLMADGEYLDAVEESISGSR